MRKRIGILLGMLIALFGMGVDYLLPGTSPGINLPQLLLIIAGLALAIGATQIGRSSVPKWIAGTSRGLIPAAIAISALTLLILEIVLVLSGWSTYFPVEVSHDDVKLVEWWQCDDKLGCRYHYEKAMEACAAGLTSGRHCKVNRQGFSDSDDFVIGADFAERTRVLVLGDSFTQGYSADIGSSYVETLEAAMPEAVVWNLGIVATGTSQALATFREYAPQFKPAITVLGFYANDFRDNVMPLQAFMLLEAHEGTVHRVRGIRFTDSWVNRSDLPIETFYAYAVHGSRPPKSELERLIGLTRLGSLALRFEEQWRRANDTSLIAYQIELTRGYLAEIQAAVHAEKSKLLALLIPERSDLSNPGALFSTSIQLMEELEIPYINLIVALDAEEDYATPPDGHWSNSGHQKVGALLSACIAAYVASGDLADCDNIVMP